MGGRGASSKANRATQASSGDASFKSVLNSELSRGLSKSQQKDFYFFSSAYGDSMLDNMAKSVTDKNAMSEIERRINNENVLINIAYPKLSGTEKQVNYAKNLISKKLSQEVDMVMSRLPTVPEKRAAAQEQFISSAKKVNPSIKTFSDAINFGLKNRKGGVLQFISENNSAAKIIEKYK